MGYIVCWLLRLDRLALQNSISVCFATILTSPDTNRPVTRKSQIFQVQSNKSHTGAMDTFNFPNADARTISRLVDYRHQTITIPTVPIRAQVFHHHGSPERAARQLDRTRQSLPSLPRRQSTTHRRTRGEMLHDRPRSLPGRGRIPRGADRLPLRTLPDALPTHPGRPRQPLERRELQRRRTPPQGGPHADGLAPDPRRPGHHDRTARRPILPPRRRHPAPRLLASGGQVRHAPLRDPHLR